MAVWRERKDALETELNKNALWAVTYGDLMSYLMIFFLVLFSFTLSQHTGKGEHVEESLVQIQKAFGGKIDPAQLEKILSHRKEDQAATRLEQILAEKKLSDIVDVISTEQRVKLVLQAPILFDLASSDLKEKAAPILLAVLEPLKDLDSEIVVEGHTDTIRVTGGRYRSNWELSMARAYSVIRFLEQNGIDPKRLSGVGHGEHRPVAPNDTPEGRAKNRRIEISLMKG